MMMMVELNYVSIYDKNDNGDLHRYDHYDAMMMKTTMSTIMVVMIMIVMFLMMSWMPIKHSSYNEDDGYIMV